MACTLYLIPPSEKGLFLDGHCLGYLHLVFWPERLVFPADAYELNVLYQITLFQSGVKLDRSIP
jgi:hypothetical protein